MLKCILICLLFSLAKPAFADTKDDVEFFMSHFISDEFWLPVRNIGRMDAPRLYRDELRASGVEVLDMERFREMVPAHTKQEIIDQQEALVADIIVEHYGAEYLSDIADFFRTPTGERMLSIAVEEDIFVYRHSAADWNEKIDSWTSYLSLQDFTQYSSFARTPAGTFFTRNTWEITRISLSKLSASPYFFQPNINQPFILEIIQTDGLVEFPNRFARQSMIRELEAVLSQ